MRRSWRWGIGLVLLLATWPDAARAQISCAPPPPPPPKRISGGEGFPPLPLPVTPLRRTERKRPPAPPTLMAKVNTGAQQVLVGTRMVWNWTTPDGDTQALFKEARNVMGINYKADVVRLSEFSFNPETVPIMYFTARAGFTLSPPQRAGLRRYVLAGGAILGAAGNGDPAFANAFAAEMRALFSDRPWFVLPPDHPLYRAQIPLKAIHYRRGASDLATQAPQLEGLNIGCRTAVLLSRADLSCGWDNHTHDEGYRVMPEDAQKLGIDILAYTLGYYRLGRVSSVPIVFREASASPGEIEVGQIVHGGDWDPSPSGLQFLLKEVSAATSGQVSYRRTPIQLEQSDLSRYPFLYITGHLDFTLTAAAATNLKNYLERGGFVLASNCCASQGFDRALRRELRRVLPDKSLRAIPANDPLYAAHFDVGAGQGGTALEGIERDGAWSVVYSAASIGTAWDREERPFVPLPDPAAAKRLGVNVLVYAMTH